MDLLQSSGELPITLLCLSYIYIYNSIYCKHWGHKKCIGLQQLIIHVGAYVTGELPILLKADHRVKFRSGLISWRWWLPSATWVTCFPLQETLNWLLLLMLKPPGRSFGSNCWFSHPASSITRHCIHMYSSCMQSVRLHASKTWPLTK